MPKTKPQSKQKKVPAHLHPHYGRRLLLWLLLFICTVLLFTLVYQSDTSSQLQQAQTSTVYQGTTPCADCTGIKTTLTLNSTPNTYTLQLVYLGKTVAPFIETGTWSLSNNSKKEMYTLNPSNSNGSKTDYQVISSTQIRQLDGDGNAIPDSMPFTLTKTE